MMIVQRQRLDLVTALPARSFANRLTRTASCGGASSSRSASSQRHACAGVLPDDGDVGRVLDDPYQHLGLIGFCPSAAGR
jgi:hypothetical protein